MELHESQEGLRELVRSADRPPRERGLAEKYSNQGRITTLMLRNIPSKYTQDMLLEEIVDCMGSSDIFDFFYLPWDQQNDCNIGYAFVNLRTVQAAERCTRIFTDFSFRRFDSSKICKVYPANIQGLENNVLHLMDRVVSEARSHYPIIMWKGEKLKLGKVIAAIDMHRKATMPVPASTPGKFYGNRDPPLPPTGCSGHGMHMEGMNQLSAPHDAEDYFAGAGDEGDGSVTTTGSGFIEAALENYLQKGSRTGRSSAPRSHMEGEGSRKGRPPPGLVDNAPENEVVEALSGLRAALQMKRQACPSGEPPRVPRPGSRQGEGSAAAAAAGLGLFSSSSGQWPLEPAGSVEGGAGGLQQCQEFFSPSSGLGGGLPPPARQPRPPGHIQAPGSWHSMTPFARSLQAPSRVPLRAMQPGARHAAGLPPGALPPGALPPGALPLGALSPGSLGTLHSPTHPAPQLHEGIADWQGCVGTQVSPHSESSPFEASLDSALDLQHGNGLMQRPFEAGSSPSSAGGDLLSVRTIELRNPDDDVLSKFLGRFGT